MKRPVVDLRPLPSRKIVVESAKKKIEPTPAAVYITPSFRFTKEFGMAYDDDDDDDFDGPDIRRRDDGPPPDNYLVQAILCTLCCCIPFGIVAIVKASQVNTLVSAGRYREALAASEDAKKWCWLAFGFGLVGGILWVIVQFAVVSQQPQFR